jgi:hypothetical protein
MAIGNINGYLGYFMTIRYILCSFGTFCVHLVHFYTFGIMVKEKSGNPAPGGCVIFAISVNNEEKK